MGEESGREGRRSRLFEGRRSRAAAIVLLVAVIAGAAAMAFVPSAASPARALFDRIGAGGFTQGSQGSARTDFLSQARGLIAHGKPDEAESLARSREAGDVEAAAVLARIAASRGRYQEALSTLEPPARRDPSGEAAVEYGLLLQLLGREEEARSVLFEVAEAGLESENEDADSLLRAARAAAALGEVETANRLFRRASQARPGDPAIETAWGEMLASKYQWGEASRSFQLALEQDATWAPAYLGMALVLAPEDPEKAAAAARRAIEIDPSLVAAHLFLAETALNQDRRDNARKAIDRALATNASDPGAHALAAALAHLDGRKSDFEAAVAKVASVNPANGAAYRVTAAHLARSYRFDEAVEMARKGVEIEPGNPVALTELGMHLMRAGDEDEARRWLEGAWERDRYHVVTYNLLELLDTLDDFVSIQSGNAVLRIHPEEAPVLRHYAVPIVEQAMKAMGGRYGLEPRGPVLVEIFPRHDDFAVRTLGLPGLLGALGACFGRVVTLDSPRARPPGSFNWQSTLWHEMAHVYSLQLSNQRVPRWLTEGISVYEEGRARPEWTGETEFLFVQAYAAGKTLDLEDLNGAFTRPDTVNLAYFQSYLAVDLLVEMHGEAGLRSLLSAFGKGLNEDEALARSIGTSLKDLQERYEALLERRYGAMARALDVPGGVDLAAQASPDQWAALSKRHPDSYPVQLAAGEALAKMGNHDAAMAAFERAASLMPVAAGPRSPRARLASVAEAAGDKVRAKDELALLLATDHTNIEAARKLVLLARETGDQQARALACERIVTLDPFDSASHTEYGRIALERRDIPLALREFRAAVDAGPIDVVSARTDLAEALVAAGNYEEARREVLRALELAPSYARAQELLLKIVEKK